MRKRVLAVIPARGGSKRLKNKNILPLAGLPMIGHTIKAALESKLFADVLVSTDSPQIAAVSRKLGASVPFLRTPELADDYTPVASATLGALNQMENYRATTYETVVQLMPNCPCRTAEDIQNAVKQFHKTGAQFQVSVFPFGFMNPWWAMRLTSSGDPQRLFPKAYQQRSQDLQSLYCPTGAVWAADVASFKKEKTFYGKGYKVFVMDWQSAVDIDDREDLKMAQSVFILRNQMSRQRA